MIDISNSSKNCASLSKDENYFHRVVKETFLACWREEKEWTVGNLTKLCSRGMMRKKKKTGNHIRTQMNFGRTLTRYSLRIFVFHFSFPFSIETVNENAPVSFLKMLWITWSVFLGPNIDRRENTSIASSRISTSFLIIFSVIFLMSS